MSSLAPVDVSAAEEAEVYVIRSSYIHAVVAQTLTAVHM